MRSFRVVACAVFLLASPLLIAEQGTKARSTNANNSHCHGYIVYVMNGQVAQPFCFDPKQTAAHPASGNGVEIYNGNQKQTHVFDSFSKNVAPAKNPSPVVIGITNGASTGKPTQPVVVNIASAGSNAQPVVVGIASSGFQSAGPVAPVAVGMSPRPAKRPPYRPAALDAQ